MEENNIENDEKNKTITHKNIAINALDNLLNHYIQNNNLKKADLLAYWFEDFAKYNLTEKSFNPQKLKKYKRGSILKANLGFNVGNEEGGLHYCIVLDKKNTMSAGILTVVPLTSIKENKKYNENYNINLGNEIYVNLKAICDNLKQALSKQYEDIWNLPAEQINKFTTDFEYIKKVQNEIDKMKKGSIAMINQITTISKQRIYDPKTNHDILSQLKVSETTLDLIDNKIKQLFLK